MKKRRYILQFVLNQYFWARNRRSVLADRLEMLRDWYSNPLSASRYSDMPKGPPCVTESVVTAGIFRAAAVVAAVEADAAKTEAAMLRAQNIIHLLGDNTAERAICELRYFEHMTWEEIGTRLSIGRRHVQRLHAQALDYLLDNPDVAEAVDDETEAYERWRAMREYSRNRAKNEVGD